MLDVSLFRDSRFSAASAAVTVSSFALFGFIFLITQYFQFVRGWGTLATGVRILPVATSIAIASLLGAWLAPRLGTKVVVCAGLVLFGTAFLWISTAGAESAYMFSIVPQMMLLGLGMGLVSTPATESILLVLPPARAGVGSAVNDATRELGGTLGVAVVGSIFSSVFASQLADGAYARLPSATLVDAQDSVGVAARVQASSSPLSSAFEAAFMSGLSAATLVVGLLCMAGALVAAVTLPGRTATPPRAHGVGEAAVTAKPVGAPARSPLSATSVARDNSSLVRENE
jgi:hypothetical protein